METFMRFLKIILIFLIAATSTNLFNTNNNIDSKIFCPDGRIETSTAFLPRSQGFDPAAFFNPYYYDCCGFTDDCYNLFFGFRYTQSIKNKNIKGTLFGKRNGDITFSGTKAAERKETDFRADDFGLAPNFLDNLNLKPQIRNYIVDFSIQFNLENYWNCLKNTYFRINTSLVNSVWDLNGKENIQKSATTDFSSFPETYMSIQAASSAENLETALSGNFLFGDMKTKWEHGKFKFKSQKKVALSNIDLILGYDLLRCDDSHFGIFLRTGIPTGTRPNAKYFFQPIIGNGHHWELGFGIDAHYNLLNCDNTCIQLYLIGNVAHLFKDTQFRSFDLKDSHSKTGNLSQNGELSRYLLLKEFSQDGIYSGNLINAINLTTKKIQSKFDIQADVMAQLIFRRCNFTFGLGYDFYFRSREKIKIKEPFFENSAKKYGIKGNTGVAARLWFSNPANPNFGNLTGNNYILHSTESEMRLFNANSIPVDNQVYLQSPVTPVGQEGARWDQLTPFSSSNIPLPDSDSLIIEDSTFKPAPVFLTDKDINICSGIIPSQISHKFFTYLNYEFENCTCYQPYLGIGTEIEIAPKCKTATLNQWGIWFHIGLNF